MSRFKWLLVVTFVAMFFIPSLSHAEVPNSPKPKNLPNLTGPVPTPGYPGYMERPDGALNDLSLVWLTGAGLYNGLGIGIVPSALASDPSFSGPGALGFLLLTVGDPTVMPPSQYLWGTVQTTPDLRALPNPIFNTGFYSNGGNFLKGVNKTTAAQCQNGAVLLSQLLTAYAALVNSGSYQSLSQELIAPQVGFPPPPLNSSMTAQQVSLAYQNQYNATVGGPISVMNSLLAAGYYLYSAIFDTVEYLAQLDPNTCSVYVPQLGLNDILPQVDEIMKDNNNVKTPSLDYALQMLKAAAETLAVVNKDATVWSANNNNPDPNGNGWDWRATNFGLPIASDLATANKNLVNGRNAAQ